MDNMETVPDNLLIRHRTTYRYSKPVIFQPHRLLLRPREGHDLRVESLKLDIFPACELTWSRDIFGNSVAYAVFSEPGAELHFYADILIKRFSGAWNVPTLGCGSIGYPIDYDVLERSMVGAYQSPVYPEESTVLQEWLQSLEIPGKESCAETLILQLTGQIYRQINYQRREQKGVQSPATTLSLGSGSCRDMATLLMESARHLEIATRFASGYLDCAATRAAQGATHAWTEVYFPGLGWRGYDPSTGKRTTHQHIVTGVSNHPRGVMPISGKFSGEATDALGMSVIVEFSSC
jgi:transglutaminase-like putative cysteine protease